MLENPNLEIQKPLSFLLLTMNFFFSPPSVCVQHVKPWLSVCVTLFFSPYFSWIRNGVQWYNKQDLLIQFLDYKLISKSKFLNQILIKNNFFLVFPICQPNVSSSISKRYIFSPGSSRVVNYLKFKSFGYNYTIKVLSVLSNITRCWDFFVETFFF